MFVFPLSQAYFVPYKPNSDTQLCQSVHSLIVVCLTCVAQMGQLVVPLSCFTPFSVLSFQFLVFFCELRNATAAEVRRPSFVQYCVQQTSQVYSRHLEGI